MKSSAKLNKYVAWLIICCFTALALFLTFNRHSHTPVFTYHSELWADKAGYYVYLPATFKYNFDERQFPDTIDRSTGDGFKFVNNKVVTKYTYGVALLELPFYLLADALATPLHFEPSGFSTIYNKSIAVASVFYLVLGLVFLAKYLRKNFKWSTIFFVLGSLFLATNLFVYSIVEVGLSHVFSFSLFCILLYFLQSTDYLAQSNFLKRILFGLLCGIIVLVRPTNVIILSVYLFLDIDNVQQILDRLKRAIRPMFFIPVFLGIITVIFPQLLYWKYTSGSFLLYSYDKEGFNWLSPKIFHVFFAPLNGLFLYTPYFFIIIGGMVYMVIKKIKNGIFMLSLFFVITYVFASWYSWYFGCAFGARSYVEYLALFSIPLAHVVDVNSKGKIRFITFSLMVLVLVFFNIKMIYASDICFYGKGDWDWKYYFDSVLAYPKIGSNW